MILAASTTHRTALLIIALLAGCYRSPQADCTIPCGAQDRCPASFTCSKGFCTRGPTCMGTAATDAGDSSEAKETADAAATDITVDSEAGGDAQPEADATRGDAGAETDADNDLPDVSDPDAADLSSDDQSSSDVTVADTNADEAESDGSHVFLPSDLPGLVLWLDPAFGITADPFRWEDRSPLHNDAVAPEQTPTVFPGGTERPAMVQFSGSNQFLRLPNGMEDFTKGMTVFVAAVPQAPLKADADDTDHPVRFFDFSAFYGTLNDSILMCRYGQTATQLLFQVCDDQRNRYLLHDNVVSNDLVQLFEAVMSGGEPSHAAALEFYKNGSFIADAVVQVPRVVARGSNLIGRSNYLDDGAAVNEDYRGRMGDIVIYNRRLTEVERLQVQRYLLARWTPG